ncbi:hypothetical protein GFS24_20310 [Chitinophaga sp. SYP-B3965]|uniref:hypothetical protein n=1 Tax=Chitinophaga sp. SYP-B3965 TaxID=2663120 RepID=UPI001299A187|nr:hypothetical protein [Chitinophaga sp. SYP-B3965]MRG47476.1 hypothetical protein [Chitinophaga sp. SYP-B3965]
MKWFTKYLKGEKRSGIFVPTESGFQEFKGDIENESINGIIEHLGYHRTQVHVLFGDYESRKIINIIVKIFTKEIVFIMAGNRCNAITTKMLDSFWSQEQVSEIYDSSNISTILDEGILARALDIDYLSQVLQIPAPVSDGMIYVSDFELYLFFLDGILVNYSSSNGLNQWAQRWKELNIDLFNSYLKVAQSHWGNNPRKILDEMNFQADAWANTPNSFSNEFTHLHQQEYNTINFFMLLVCHYGKSITLDEFLEINHGRYWLSNELKGKNMGERYFVVGNFEYEFSPNGELLNHRFYQ